MRRLLANVMQARIGLALTALILVGTGVFVALQGPLYGVWGWPELVLGALILTSFAFAGVEMLFRPPNPYARSNPRYELRDIAPHRDLDSGGSGWLIQSLPLLATAAVLALVFILV